MKDYIDRQAAIDALKEKVFHNLSDEFYGAMQVLDELPSAEVEPVKKGKWIKTNNPSLSPFVPGSEWVYICLECECVFDDDWKYCPNCGAKMN